MSHAPQIDFLSPSDESPLPIKKAWKDVLAGEKRKEYFKDLIQFVEGERGQGKIVYPPNDQVFNALHSTPLEDVKVVILGQDPYHGPRQAHGLCFSVGEEVPPPPSLVNIFKELHSDLGLEIPRKGYLAPWASQGVLLLNAVLTVEAGRPGSHANKGWETFTDKVVSVLNSEREGLVFLLWGSYAQKKGSIIDRKRHTVLTAPHPSPLSAHRGFLGCKHFSKANDALLKQGIEPINWKLTRDSK